MSSGTFTSLGQSEGNVNHNPEATLSFSGLLRHSA